MPNCYLCGADNATKRKSIILKDSFTNHNMARCPSSDFLCDRCAWVIPLRCSYFNSSKGTYVKLFSRTWSWLLSEQESYPKFGRLIDGLPEVTELPTRSQIKEWLCEPPQPPFTIAIAESGQKHILSWAKEALDRDCFPVQFELDTLMVDRHRFVTLLSACERLLGLGFSKTEILTGDYSIDRCAKNIKTFTSLDTIIAPARNTRLISLLLWVANTPKKISPAT